VRNRSVVILLMELFFLLLTVSSSFAVDTFYLQTADGVDGNVKSTFGWDETPWLHLHFPLNAGFVTSSQEWTSPSLQTYYTSTSPQLTQDIWVSLDNSSYGDWADVKEGGIWNTDGTWEGVGSAGGQHSYTTSFTVTPEPVSSALFLIGGLSLAGVAYKRRKKSSV